MKRILTYFTIVLLTGCSSGGPESPHASGSSLYGSIDNIRDIPKPSNLRIHYADSMVLGSGDSWVGHLVYECGENPNYMWDFLQAEMQKLGWSPLSAIRANISVMVFKRGNRVATIQLKERLLFGSIVNYHVAPESNGSGGGVGFTSSPSDYSGFGPSSGSATQPSAPAFSQPGQMPSSSPTIQSLD